METKLTRLIQFVEGYHKAFNEQAFALNIGEEFKAIGKKAYEQAKKYCLNLSDSSKKKIANKFPDFFTKNMDIQKTMFYVE